MRSGPTMSCLGEGWEARDQGPTIDLWWGVPEEGSLGPGLGAVELWWTPWGVEGDMAEVSRVLFFCMQEYFQKCNQSVPQMVEQKPWIMQKSVLFLVLYRTARQAVRINPVKQTVVDTKAPQTERQHVEKDLIINHKCWQADQQGL